MTPPSRVPRRSTGRACLRLIADAQARRFDVIITESLDRLSRSQADIAALLREAAVPRRAHRDARRRRRVRDPCRPQGHHVGAVPEGPGAEDAPRADRPGQGGPHPRRQELRLRRAQGRRRAGTPRHQSRPRPTSCAASFASTPRARDRWPSCATSTARACPDPPAGIGTPRPCSARPSGATASSTTSSTSARSSTTASASSKTRPRASASRARTPRGSGTASPPPSCASSMIARGRLVQRRRAERGGPHLYQQRRPQRPLSGLIYCGACGAKFIVATHDYLRCSARTNRGTCETSRTLLMSEVEQRVLSALRSYLLSPDVVASAVEAYQTRAQAARRGAAPLTPQAGGRRRRGRAQDLAAVDAGRERPCRPVATGPRINELVAERKRLAEALSQQPASNVRGVLSQGRRALPAEGRRHSCRIEPRRGRAIARPLLWCAR